MDDKIDGVVITFVDITERLHVEEALRESERRLREQKSLVDLARDPIFIWDFDGAILEWNRGCEALYGYSRVEAVGRKIHELLGTTVPGSSVGTMRSTLLRDGIWSGELQQRAKDRQIVVTESRLQLESIDGRRFVFETCRDLGDRKRWEQRQEMLVDEIKHRVKNIITVVQALASQTAKEAPAVADFNTVFRGRLSALASAHDLLVQSEWKGADLEALVRSELKPYDSKQVDRVRVSGSPILLPSTVATPFGLVLHELTVNAAKHGALSVPDGNVEVSWAATRRDGKEWLALIWREQGGPAIGTVKSAGDGSVLIEHALPDARIRRNFESSGLVCTIEMPLAPPEERL
jgi:two-component system CheB/CheR fusion protein